MQIRSTGTPPRRATAAVGWGIAGLQWEGLVIPGEFSYHRPGAVDEVLALLARHGEEAKLLAGGQSLLPLMKLRLAAPAHLIDLNRIAALKGIREDGGEIRIGAMTTENELIASALLWAKCPLIPEAAQAIADPQVRNRGTLGGDIVHGDPGNDQPAIMMALDASLVLSASGGERVVPANGFYVGIFETQMAPSELLTEIRVPIPPAGTGHSYRKLKRKVGDFATAAAAALITLDGGTCSRAAVTLTNAGSTPVRVSEAEALLTGQAIDAALIDRAAERAVAASDPVEDLRGSVDYKKHMAGEMTKRALTQALARAKEG